MATRNFCDMCDARIIDHEIFGKVDVSSVPISAASFTWQMVCRKCIDSVKAHIYSLNVKQPEFGDYLGERKPSKL
jgi:hypothetical protein